MRIRDRISPAKAARMLGVHYNTVLSWCRAAIDGEPSPLADVQQHVTGYYWIAVSEIRALRRYYPKRTNDSQ